MSKIKNDAVPAGYKIVPEDYITNPDYHADFMKMRDKWRESEAKHPDLKESEEPDSGLGLMDIKQAAEALRMSPATLRNWVSTRKVPFIKMEGRVLFDREDLKKWLAEKKVRAAERD